jgi:hypothetical protein
LLPPLIDPADRAMQQPRHSPVAVSGLPAVHPVEFFVDVGVE